MKTIWIYDFQFDVIECTAVVSLTTDPDKGVVEEELHFHEVGNISVDRYHEPASGTRGLGDWSDLELTAVDSGRCRFKVNTGDAFVRFEANGNYERK